MTRTHAVEAIGLEMTNRTLDTWDKLGYDFVAMSQVVRSVRERPLSSERDMTITTLVFKLREEPNGSP